MRLHGETEGAYSSRISVVAGPGILLIKPKEKEFLISLAELMARWSRENVNLGTADSPSYAEKQHVGTPPGGTPPRNEYATHFFHTLAVMVSDANGNMREIAGRVLGQIDQDLRTLDVLFGIADYSYNPRQPDNARSMVKRAGDMIEQGERDSMYVSTASFRRMRPRTGPCATPPPSPPS